MNTRALISAALAGLIRPQVADVNMVSAPIMVKERGIIVAEVKRDIAQVTQPLLVLRSTEDHVVEASNSQWILDNVASDDLTFIELRNSFHVATLDYDAEVIFAESVAFMERVTASKV